MTAWLNFNGKFKEGGTPVITADNRGFRYGDGIFETIRAEKEQIPHWELHAERLFRSAQTLSLDLPAMVNSEELRKQIVLTLRKNAITGLARVRLTIFRGDGGLFETQGKGGGYLIQAWPLEKPQVEYNSNGLVVGVYPDGKKSCDLLSSLKSNNYLLSVMAALFARKNQLNDALILNTHDRICESSIANVFWVAGSSIFTPPVSEGCVAGVMRKHLMRQLSVTEKPISQEDLQTADEVFLTNAVFGLRWVQTINQQTFGNKLSKEIFKSTF